MIYASRRGNVVFATERLKPAAPGVVEVSRDGTDRSLRYAGNSNVPKCWWQGLNELHRDAVVGPPGSEQARPYFGFGRHVEAPRQGDIQLITHG